MLKNNNTSNHNNSNIIIRKIEKMMWQKMKILKLSEEQVVKIKIHCSVISILKVKKLKKNSLKKNKTANLQC